MSHESMSQIWKNKSFGKNNKITRYFYVICLLASLLPAHARPISPGGEDSAYERGGDARQKFWIKPLKETDQGVAQAFFDP